ILRFDDNNHSLTAKNGLSIKELSELLSSLYEAINVSNKDTLVLSEIRGNCYALNLTTNNELIYENLKVVHKKISHNDFDGLNKKQISYAEKVKTILKGNLSLQAYDDSKTFNFEVKDINIVQDLPSFYFEINSEYGIITSIGGRSIEGVSNIRINGQNYDIKVSAKQERELLPFFKKNRLHLVLNKKIATDDNEIKSATLESFEITDDINFYDNLQNSISELSDKVFEAFNERYED
ncbi:MAG TPA: hypothetical protein DCM02_05810, partial [Flavobacterium sp.]|nr:hypothetical protein [Flavobacterium sp.]